MFDHSRVTALRRTVASRARESGLASDRLGDFVMAVNELLTNVVRHGGGTGCLTLWIQDGAVLCEISDRGDGLDSGDGPGRVSPRRPAPDQPGGWGLWLVRELTDTCEIKSGPDGTAVRISSRTHR